MSDPTFDIIHPRIKARIEETRQQRSRTLATACVQTLAGLHDISLVLSLVRNPSDAVRVAAWRGECSALIAELARLATDDSPDPVAVDTAAARVVRFLDELAGIHGPDAAPADHTAAGGTRSTDDAAVVHLIEAADALGRIARMTNDPVAGALSDRSLDAAGDLRALLRTPAPDLATLEAIRCSVAALGGAVDALHRRAMNERALGADR